MPGPDSVYVPYDSWVGAAGELVEGTVKGQGGRVGLLFGKTIIADPAHQPHPPTHTHTSTAAGADEGYVGLWKGMSARLSREFIINMMLAHASHTYLGKCSPAVHATAEFVGVRHFSPPFCISCARTRACVCVPSGGGVCLNPCLSGDGEWLPEI